MRHSWHSAFWSKFDYHLVAAKPYWAAAVVASGEVSGLQARLERSDLEELRLTPIVQEALASFGIQAEDLGRWRQFGIDIVRSAADGLSDIFYEAPLPDKVDAEMVAFIDWLNDKPELPVPLVAAIAHLWFQSIHPFSDGNGRVGRALIEYVLASRSRVLPFSLSRQIEKDKKAERLARERSMPLLSLSGSWAR